MFSFNTEIKKETFINTCKLSAEVLERAQNIEALEKAADRVYEKLYLKADAHEDGKVTAIDLKDLKVDEDFLNDTILIVGFLH